jgi:polygalacturonase
MGKVRIFYVNLRISLSLVFLCMISIVGLAKDYNISDFGAIGDGKFLCSTAIQKAINECSASGGGTVFVPGGTFLTGTILLKDNVELHLAKDAVLLASVNHPQDYQAGRGVIVADGISNASVTGFGTINGQGGNKRFQYGDNKGDRPHVVLFKDSKNIVLKDVHLINSAWWTVFLFRCDGVRVDGITIHSQVNLNNDGLDVDSRNVTISNCVIDCDDDGLCFKSDDSNFLVKNITVTNCTISSNCNAIKFGTASRSGFKDITISNCLIHNASESNLRKWSSRWKNVPSDTTGLAGIAIESVDGAHIERININNISMTGIMTPLFIRLGNRSGIHGEIRDVIISSITAKSRSMITSSITGIPGARVQGITLRDLIFDNLGKGTLEEASAPVPEQVKSYPENGMFGTTLPAHGLYIRHADNITMENVQFRTTNPDERPAIIMDDLTNVSLQNFQAEAPSSVEALIKLINCKNILISEYRQVLPPIRFLKVEGAASKQIRVVNNNLTKIKAVVDIDKQVPKNAVLLKYN